MLARTTVLQYLLEENQNHQKIKETVKLIAEAREKITFHALISSNNTYLQVRGLANHEYDHFNYINKMLNQKVSGVAQKIKKEELPFHNIVSQWEQAEIQRKNQQNQVDQEIQAEVQYVVNNVDLPISLFKRNDKYWYPDNPKTIEAKKYVHDRITQDRQVKRKIKSEINKRQSEKQKLYKTECQKQQKMEEEKIKMKHGNAEKKIEELKKNKEEREKMIKESEKYGSALKPLFKKIKKEEERKNISALEEYKQKLGEIRNLHRSIDAKQIQEHKDKLLKLQQQRTEKKILDNPLKVSFKSKFHQSMVASRMSEYETTKSLYDKRRQYGTMIKKEFKPSINQELASEMEERLKIMARRRTRKNPKKKEQKRKAAKNSDDDDEDSQEEEESNKPETPKKSINFNSDQEDDDEENSEEEKPKQRIRGEDEDPDRQERYELGMDYLQYVRNLPKKKKQVENVEQSKVQESAVRTQRYKDYLKEMTKTKRQTIDHIDSSKMKKTYNQSILRTNDFELIHKLENQARVVENKIKNEEELLKFRKMEDRKVMEKKVQIDNAVVDTIKARLAMLT